jgi:hypothetical protein
MQTLEVPKPNHNSTYNICRNWKCSIIISSFAVDGKYLKDFFKPFTEV